MYYASSLKEFAKQKNYSFENAVEFMSLSGLPEGDIQAHKTIKFLIRSLSYKTPTTGFALILLTSILCKGRVRVFGFDTYTTSKGIYLENSIRERKQLDKVHTLAAAYHEIHYEYWYCHYFCKHILFSSKLSIL